ncbi:MAG: UDP-N-acetylmuramoyl-L-alanine--D-glutamate ligase [Planctomycetota bacterium]|nr:UDP-N-acetylmuramoyl-L-alanine--D-glutamate ligase [Planctomycetota bacterium]
MIGEFNGKTITVMGLGRFGGGLGVTRWLASQGARVLVTDLEPEDRLAASLKGIEDLIENDVVELRLGAHNLEDFRKADLVVANPAVPKPWDNEFLLEASKAGVPITTEIRLLMERLDRRRVIGVTGTAGKSTTTAMIHHVLQETGHSSHVGGNIGGSLLSRLDAIGPEDWIVLELSSSMLYWLGKGVGYSDAEGISPHVALLTNIEPNHLDWHGTFEHYRESKENIFRYQESDGARITSELFHQRRKLPLKIPGDHNQLNGQFAIMAALKAANVLPSDSAPRLATFEGLPHRLQLVAQHGEQQFFNDSKSTTPQATVLAVQAFKKPSKIHLIVGGYDKKIDLSPIAALTPKIAGLYTIGATGEALAQKAESIGNEASVGEGHVAHCEALEVAIEQAKQRMEDDHILLLSPGCASWDQFDNYEQRGDRFVNMVTSQIQSP